jgi:hypothetical protein
MYELVTVKFHFSNLADDVDMSNLKDELRKVLKDVVMQLAQRVSDMGISSIDQSTTIFIENDEGGGDEDQGIDIYYDVKIVKVPDQEFAPLVIQEVIDSYQNMVEDLNIPIDVFLNICFKEGGKAGGGGDTAFDKCAVKPEEVATKFSFTDLPQELLKNTTFVDDINLQMIEAYQDILSPDANDAFDGMVLLSIKDDTEVSLKSGSIDMFYNLIVRGVNDGLMFAPAINEIIASESSKEVIFDRIKSYTTANDWNVNWCVNSERMEMYACEAPKDPIAVVATAKTPFPGWGYAVIGGVVGLIILFCLCCVCRCRPSCANRKVSRGRTKSAEAKNQLNMESYIDYGRPAQRRSNGRRRSSTNSRRRSSYEDFERERRVRRRSSSGEHGQRRRHSSQRRHERHRSQSQHRRRHKSREKSRRMSKDSEQENQGDRQLVVFDEGQINKQQMVPYEGGEQTQQLALYNEEEQPKRPDPDGLTSSDHLMIMDTKMDQVSIGTNDKDEDSQVVMIEEGRPVYVDDPPMQHSSRRTRID